ncbi:MAG TPA: hypothetical protein VHO68_05705 [Bacteroidales bacterium]|nr:hypothetical protein [Bacteroidales bacterium]
MAEEPYGSWIEVKNITPDSMKAMEIKGELIAAGDDTLYVLDNTSLTLRTIPASKIRSARLVRYYANEAGVAALSALGAMSTLSNGLFLIFTFPGWIVGGSISSVARSYDPVMDYPDVKLREFSPYARFPQGFPKGVNKYFFGPKQFTRPIIAVRDTNKTN